MKYVLDSSFFVIIRGYYPDTFPTFWEKMDEMAEKGRIISVDEVYAEVKNYKGKQHKLSEWVKNHKRIFTPPTDEEQYKIKEIFKIQGFEDLVSKKHLIRGTPCADPFLIARAFVINGTVVTQERPAKKDKKGNVNGSIKIPNVCEHFKIPCINTEEFMVDQKWKF